MALSRKRSRELKRLKHSASDLWDDQREVLEQASKVVREAGRQVGHISRDEVAPRVRSTVSHGAAATRHKVQNEIFPSVASALASALAVIEVTKDARVRDAMKAVQKAGEKKEHVLDVSSKKAKKKAKKLRKELGKKVSFVPPKSTPGPGRYIVMGVAAVAVAGIGYAIWQTLRADDDLWISDEPEDLSKPEAL
ncbi:hypothetical protein OH146_08520 [Salinibacterium sp. SYSU T00001]|uniref:hypothetical protein n=1 Tax=Homoserinimonas sedimenticola TaxID=2986805 RepID=UPI002235A844|nr:hypothetical protein [Salinibacterium sedimenticola]MCW4385816.1 hypothetical protein [Salinibacterium sedimenticola]